MWTERARIQNEMSFLEGLGLHSHSDQHTWELSGQQPSPALASHLPLSPLSHPNLNLHRCARSQEKSPS